MKMIRYMGTKARLAPVITAEIAALKPRGLVLDAFAGTGSLAASLQEIASVHVNDHLLFPTVLNAAQLRAAWRPDAAFTARILDLAKGHARKLQLRFSVELLGEGSAVESRSSLLEWMEA